MRVRALTLAAMASMTAENLMSTAYRWTCGEDEGLLVRTVVSPRARRKHNDNLVCDVLGCTWFRRVDFEHSSCLVMADNEGETVQSGSAVCIANG